MTKMDQTLNICLVVFLLIINSSVGLIENYTIHDEVPVYQYKNNRPLPPRIHTFNQYSIDRNCPCAPVARAMFAKDLALSVLTSLTPQDFTVIYTNTPGSRDTVRADIVRKLMNKLMASLTPNDKIMFKTKLTTIRDGIPSPMYKPMRVNRNRLNGTFNDDTGTIDIVPENSLLNNGSSSPVISQGSVLPGESSTELNYGPIPGAKYRGSPEKEERKGESVDIGENTDKNEEQGHTEEKPTDEDKGENKEPINGNENPVLENQEPVGEAPLDGNQEPGVINAEVGGDEGQIGDNEEPDDGDEEPPDGESPGRDEEPPGGDEELPGGDEQPPGGDEQPPGGDEEPPDGDEEPPGGDEQPGEGDEEPPGGDEKPPAGEGEPPGGDKKPPGGDGETPARDEEPPEGDEPPGGDEEPLEGDEEPPGGGEEPIDGSEEPIENEESVNASQEPIDENEELVGENEELVGENEELLDGTEETVESEELVDKIEELIDESDEPIDENEEPTDENEEPVDVSEIQIIEKLSDSNEEPDNNNTENKSTGNVGENKKGNVGDAQETPEKQNDIPLSDSPNRRKPKRREQKKRRPETLDGNLLPFLEPLDRIRKRKRKKKKYPQTRYFEPTKPGGHLNRRRPPQWPDYSPFQIFETPDNLYKRRKPGSIKRKWKPKKMKIRQNRRRPDAPFSAPNRWNRRKPPRRMQRKPKWSRNRGGMPDRRRRPKKPKFRKRGRTPGVLKDEFGMPEMNTFEMYRNVPAFLQDSNYLNHTLNEGEASDRPKTPIGGVPMFPQQGGPLNYKLDGDVVPAVQPQVLNQLSPTAMAHEFPFDLNVNQQFGTPKTNLFDKYKPNESIAPNWSPMGIEPKFPQPSRYLKKRPHQDEAPDEPQTPIGNGPTFPQEDGAIYYKPDEDVPLDESESPIGIIPSDEDESLNYEPDKDRIPVGIIKKIPQEDGSFDYKPDEDIAPDYSQSPTGIISQITEDEDGTLNKSKTPMGNMPTILQGDGSLDYEPDETPESPTGSVPTFPQEGGSFDYKPNKDLSPDGSKTPIGNMPTVPEGDGLLNYETDEALNGPETPTGSVSTFPQEGVSLDYKPDVTSDGFESPVGISKIPQGNGSKPMIFQDALRPYIPQFPKNTSFPGEDTFPQHGNYQHLKYNQSGGIPPNKTATPLGNVQTFPQKTTGTLYQPFQKEVSPETGFYKPEAGDGKYNMIAGIPGFQKPLGVPSIQNKPQLTTNRIPLWMRKKDRLKLKGMREDNIKGLPLINKPAKRVLLQLCIDRHISFSKLLNALPLDLQVKILEGISFRVKDLLKDLKRKSQAGHPKKRIINMLRKVLIRRLMSQRKKAMQKMQPENDIKPESALYEKHEGPIKLRKPKLFKGVESPNKNEISYVNDSGQVPPDGPLNKRKKPEGVDTDDYSDLVETTKRGNTSKLEMLYDDTLQIKKKKQRISGEENGPDTDEVDNQNQQGIDLDTDSEMLEIEKAKNATTLEMEYKDNLELKEKKRKFLTLDQQPGPNIDGEIDQDFQDVGDSEILNTKRARNGTKFEIEYNDILETKDKTRKPLISEDLDQQSGSGIDENYLDTDSEILNTKTTRNGTKLELEYNDYLEVKNKKIKSLRDKNLDQESDSGSDQEGSEDDSEILESEEMRNKQKFEMSYDDGLELKQKKRKPLEKGNQELYEGSAPESSEEPAEGIDIDTDSELSETTKTQSMSKFEIEHEDDLKSREKEEDSDGGSGQSETIDEPETVSDISEEENVDVEISKSSSNGSKLEMQYEDALQTRRRKKARTGKSPDSEPIEEINNARNKATVQFTYEDGLQLLKRKKSKPDNRDVDFEDDTEISETKITSGGSKFEITYEDALQTRRRSKRIKTKKKVDREGDVELIKGGKHNVAEFGVLYEDALQTKTQEKPKQTKLKSYDGQPDASKSTVSEDDEYELSAIRKSSNGSKLEIMYEDELQVIKRTITSRSDKEKNTEAAYQDWLKAKHVKQPRQVSGKIKQKKSGRNSEIVDDTENKQSHDTTPWSFEQMRSSEQQVEENATKREIQKLGSEMDGSGLRRPKLSREEYRSKDGNIEIIELFRTVRPLIYKKKMRKITNATNRRTPKEFFYRTKSTDPNDENKSPGVPPLIEETIDYVDCNNTQQAADADKPADYKETVNQGIPNPYEKRLPPPYDDTKLVDNYFSTYSRPTRLNQQNKDPLVYKESEIKIIE